METQSITSRDIAKKCANVADELKATDIVILDVRTLCDFTDYMVICTGDNRRQLRAIQRKVYDELAALRRGRPRVEGGPDASRSAEAGTGWILIDYFDVVVHAFDPGGREFYDLELLWGDAPRVAWNKKTAAKR